MRREIADVLETVKRAKDREGLHLINRSWLFR